MRPKMMTQPTALWSGTAKIFPTRVLPLGWVLPTTDDTFLLQMTPVGADDSDTHGLLTSSKVCPTQPLFLHTGSVCPPLPHICFWSPIWGTALSFVHLAQWPRARVANGSWGQAQEANEDYKSLWACHLSNPSTMCRAMQKAYLAIYGNKRGPVPIDVHANIPTLSSLYHGRVLLFPTDRVISSEQ